MRGIDNLGGGKGMQRITRREFVKRTAVTSAAFTSLPAILAACGTSTGTSNKPSKLVIAAVKGNENAPMKKVAPKYQSETGITMEIVEIPYHQPYQQLATTFPPPAPSYNPCTMLSTS